MTVDAGGPAGPAGPPGPSGAPAGEAAVPPIAPVGQVELPPIRPGLGWFVLGVAVIAVGLAGGFALLTTGAFGYLNDIDDLDRVEIPGEAQFAADGGTVVVYHEPEGGPRADLSDLEVVVVDPAGDVVAVDGSQSSDRYVVEDRRGIEIGRFRAPVDGEYAIRVSGDASGVLAVGPSPRRRLTTFGLAAVVLAVVGIVVGTVILVVTRRRRFRAQHERIERQLATHVERLGERPPTA